MAGLRRRVARVLERLAGVHIVHPAEAYQLNEQLHLRRFFAHFGVDCVFDVGANAGQYATFLRERVGYRGRIVSFEPIPELAQRLTERAAGDPLWSVVAMALDREAGPATFHVMAETVFSSLHAPLPDQPQAFGQMNRPVRKIQVMRAALDAEFDRLQAEHGFQRPFLKMDTQGNDLAVAQGGPRAMGRFVGLQSELAIRPTYDDAPGYVETLNAYQAMGFKLSAMVPNTRGHFPDLLEIDCIMYRDGAGLGPCGAPG